MTEPAAVTDAMLARARQDPIFWQQLVADHLQRLLSELNRLRSAAPDAAHADQIREGVDLAVRLAELLQKIANRGNGTTRAA
jgi:hypothetical protein